MDTRIPTSNSRTSTTTPQSSVFCTEAAHSGLQTGKSPKTENNSEDTIVDMDRLDPNFITFAEMKKKFPLFDDNVIEMLCECENKKLEDARIPPLIVRNENVTLTDNLSTIKYIDDKENSKSETISSTNSESGDRGTAEEKEKKEEEEVSV